MRGIGTGLVAVCALALTPGAAHAQGNQIRIIHGVQAGATTDTIGRILAEKMRVTLGENVIVEPKPGAGQRIAMGELMKSPADGRTILLSASALWSIIPHIYGDQTGFDPFKDALPVTRTVTFQVGVGAATNIGASNIAEFVKWAKANPGKASYGSPGAGTSSHFTGILLAKAIGVNMVHVPYRGGAPALADLTAGHLPMMFTSVSDYPEFAKAGKMRILAVAGPRRSPVAPDVPTLKEQGVDIAFESAFDMHIKAGVGPDVVRRLNDAVVKAIREPDVTARLIAMGVQPSASTPEDLAKWQAAEHALWAEPVKSSGFKGE